MKNVKYLFGKCYMSGMSGDGLMGISVFCGGLATRGTYAYDSMMIFPFSIAVINKEILS